MKPSSHSALYNWGVALSDMSRVLKSTDRIAANKLLSEAADKYATSLQHHANNPQVSNSLPIYLTEALWSLSPLILRSFEGAAAYVPLSWKLWQC